MNILPINSAAESLSHCGPEGNRDKGLVMGSYQNNQPTFLLDKKPLPVNMLTQ